MVSKAKLSVIIPTVGRAECLTNCIQSLLFQTILPGEIIIVDNSRKHSVKKIIEMTENPNRVRLVYIRERRIGSAYSRNTGIAVASYDLVAFIDDDCTVNENWIQEVLNSDKVVPNQIHSGINLNGDPSDLFSCLDYFHTESFFKFAGNNGFKNRNTSFLDSKNFTFRKSYLLKKSIFFDPSFTRITDLDFSLNLRKFGIKIFINRKMIALHWGKTDFIDHIKTQFNNGKNFYRLLRKWGAFELNKNLIFSSKIRRKHSDTIVKKNILKGKKFYFKFVFNLMLLVGSIFYALGIYYETLKNNFSSLFCRLHSACPGREPEIANVNIKRQCK